MHSQDRKAYAAARRTVLRGNAALRAEIERLSSLEQGGSFERPVEVRSASEIEVRAESIPRAACGGPCHLEEHTVLSRGPARRRVARVLCEMCGTERSLYFRVGSALPS